MRNRSHPTHRRDISDCWFEWGRWGQRPRGTWRGRGEDTKAQRQSEEGEEQRLRRALLGELLPGRRGPCRKQQERLWIQDTEGRVAGLVPQHSTPERAQGGTRLLQEEGSGYSSVVRKAELVVGDQWTGRREGEKGEREGCSGRGGRKEVLRSLPHLIKAVRNLSLGHSAARTLWRSCKEESGRSRGDDLRKGVWTLLASPPSPHRKCLIPGECLKAFISY